MAECQEIGPSRHTPAYGLVCTKNREEGTCRIMALGRVNERRGPIIGVYWGLVVNSLQGRSLRLAGGVAVGFRASRRCVICVMPAECRVPANLQVHVKGDWSNAVFIWTVSARPGTKGVEIRGAASCNGNSIRTRNRGRDAICEIS